MGVIYPVILCGGGGTRLWPLSRTYAPKQLQALITKRSMLVETAARIADMTEMAPPIIVCNEAYSDVIADDLNSHNLTASDIIIEPFGKNTAPAALCAAELITNKEPEASLLLLPSDHYISDIEAFTDAILKAAKAANRGYLATFAITPEYPETGYGYIKTEAEVLTGTTAYKVARFVEKPALKTARAYLSEGGYYWNSGMFLMRAQDLLQTGKEHCKDLSALSVKAMQQAAKRTYHATSMHYLEADSFDKIKGESLDIAVMEKADNVAAIKASIGWSDVGGWPALKDLKPQDADQNVVEGDVFLDGTKNTYIKGGKRFIAAIDLNDLIIVDDEDALLIAHRHGAQKVKDAHAFLTAQKRPEADFSASGSQKAWQTYQAQKAISWLTELALPFWAEDGFDTKTGLPFEDVNYRGEPLFSRPRRLRVTARQIYVYSWALSEGVFHDKTILEALLKSLEDKWQIDQRWIKTRSEDGLKPDDRSSDLYDLAFVLFGLAHAYKVTAEPSLKTLALETLDFIETHMRSAHGGFAEVLPDRTTKRRANPHMHLLEAALAWVELHKSERFLSLANELTGLYQTHFVHNALIREYYDMELNLLDESDEDRFIEAGHVYEWAYLMQRYQALTGQNVAASAPGVAFADSYGHHAQTGLICDGVMENGRTQKPTARLWPQAEYGRYHLIFGDDRTKRSALKQWDRLYQNYFLFNGQPTGYWRDVISDEGEDKKPNASPASSLYHIIGFIDALIKTR